MYRYCKNLLSDLLSPIFVILIEKLHYLQPMKRGNVMDNKKPEQITIEEELHICPECGYEDGFHTSFVRDKPAAFNVLFQVPNLRLTVV